MRQRLSIRTPDRFRSFLHSQLMEQRNAYDVHPGRMHGEERVEFIRWNVLAAHRELGEMLNSVDGWKPWQTIRDNAGEFKDRDEFVEDAVDVLKFVGNLLLTAGVTDAELSRVWDRKSRVNAKRQADGYAGVGKDHEPHDVHLSDFAPTRSDHVYEDFMSKGENTQ